MSAYVVAQIRIDDLDEYQLYLDSFYPSFERHGGELLATTRNSTEVMEGEWAYPSTVILKFPSLEAAHAWHADPEYVTVAAHRHKAAKTNLVIVEGFS